MFADKKSDSKKTPNVQTKQFLRSKLESAKWFIDAVHQRRKTMLSVMRKIVSFQEAFFTYVLPRRLCLPPSENLHTPCHHRSITLNWDPEEEGFYDFFQNSDSLCKRFLNLSITLGKADIIKHCALALREEKQACDTLLKYDFFVWIAYMGVSACTWIAHGTEM